MDGCLRKWMDVDGLRPLDFGGERSRGPRPAASRQDADAVNEIRLV